MLELTSYYTQQSPGPPNYAGGSGEFALFNLSEIPTSSFFYFENNFVQAFVF